MIFEAHAESAQSAHAHAHASEITVSLHSKLVILIAYLRLFSRWPLRGATVTRPLTRPLSAPIRPSPKQMLKSRIKCLSSELRAQRSQQGSPAWSAASPQNAAQIAFSPIPLASCPDPKPKLSAPVMPVSKGRTPLGDLVARHSSNTRVDQLRERRIQLCMFVRSLIFDSAVAKLSMFWHSPQRRVYVFAVRTALRGPIDTIFAPRPNPPVLNRRPAAAARPATPSEIAPARANRNLRAGPAGDRWRHADAFRASPSARCHGRSRGAVQLSAAGHSGPFRAGSASDGRLRGAVQRFAAASKCQVAGNIAKQAGRFEVSRRRWRFRPCGSRADV